MSTSQLAISDSILESGAFRLDDVRWGYATKKFRQEGAVLLKKFLKPEFLSEIRELADELFVRDAHRNDFLMPQTRNTPRHIDVVGGNVMQEQSRIMSLYKETAASEWLKDLAGTEISLCPNLTEHVIMTRLTSPGDTHGWHTDDYAYALIMCIEYPGSKSGGQVQYLDTNGDPREIMLEPGDAYLMRTDKVLHRVAPLSSIAYGPRTILNFTYGDNTVVHPNGSADFFCTTEKPNSAEKPGIGPDLQLSSGFQAPRPISARPTMAPL